MIESSTPSKPSVKTPAGDLEIKDAKLIFANIWEQLESDLGHDQLRFPKEIILLGGAPGAGKRGLIPILSGRPGDTPALLS